MSEEVLRVPLNQHLGFHKSNYEALRLKELGNAYFRSKDPANDAKSLQCYTQAIFLAQWPSGEQRRLAKELNDSLDEFKRCSMLPFNQRSDTNADPAILATCLGNRSAALYNLKKFNECLVDIDLALSLGFPAAMEYKLHKRRTLCLAKLEEESLRVETMKDKRKASHCNSRGCFIQTSPEKGQYMVAATEFKPGDIIATEIPYAAVLDTKFTYTHCSRCFKETLCLFPCSWCSSEGYCTPHCRAIAWSDYHWLECSVAEKWTKVDWILKLCLRIVLSATSNEVLDVLSASSSSFHGESRYKSIVSLVAHKQQFSDPTQKNTLEKMAQSLVKLFGGIILHYLQEAEKLLQTATKSHTLVTTDHIEKLFLHHLLQLRCNSHSIPTIGGAAHSKDNDSSNVQNCSQVQLGSVIFSTASMLNHSCHPNAFFQFDGSNVTVVATRAIQKGEEINNCYGPQVGRMKKTERQLHLKAKYFFDCHCAACESSGGELLYREVAMDALACPQCNGPLLETTQKSSACCLKCKTILSQTEVDIKRKVSTEAEDLFVEATCDEKMNLELLLKCQKLQQEVLCTDNMALSRTHDMLSKHYFMQGNFKLAAQLCRLSCSTVGMIYGSDSIELANELHKLANIFMMSQNVTEALQAAHRAQALLHIYNGEDHPDCSELNELIKILQN